ncbi:peptidase domain protein [Pirellula staleyi DSM 6068]|uniref:Peptidase domain protein n=1 Tax=Pirellula staleyi (strain ATCC 27377 / DSM 6068 / ICPB 4128) TaxID=530564 RepID=D2QYN3_PIRSD|nr:pre-peptidase C-terminal domain-containing protein [Pirellula staleyi]ADB18192.1 peptidase domain protein [Pirellula staleyi DSM 6068]
MPAFFALLAAAMKRAVSPLAMVLAMASVAVAQMPRPQLASIFPPGGRQGTTVEVTLAGTDLDDITQLVFSHPGIAATPKMSAPTEFEPTAKPIANVYTLQIAGDVPAGVYEVRAFGRFGLSSARRFVVSGQEEVVEAAANSAIENAVAMTLGQVFSGRVDASNSDFFKLSLKQGEKVTIDVTADRIDSRLSPLVAVLSSDGKQLARARANVARDAQLVFTAPTTGDFLIKLNDSIFGGGPDYFYRLSVSSSPIIDFVFPPAGVPGSSGAYWIYGRNLPGSQPADGMKIDGVPLEKVQLNIGIPGDGAAHVVCQQAPTRGAWLDTFEHKHNFGSATVGIPLQFATAPVVLEQQASDKTTDAQVVTLPVDIAGQFYPEGDVDWYQFDAKKGDIYWIEVISNQAGLESDPAISFFRITKDEAGVEKVNDLMQVDDSQERQQRIGSDFDSTSDDPSLRFLVPEDGTYRVLVRDQFGEGVANPGNVYRLAMRPLAPDFRLLVENDPPEAGRKQNNNQIPSGALALYRGSNSSVDVVLQRRDDFQGEVQLSVEGLPAGVTCTGALLGGEVNRAKLVFSANDQAANWCGTIRVIGKSIVGDKELVREARYAQVTWGTPNRQQQPGKFRLTPHFYLAVAEKDTLPVQVTAGEDKVWETSLGGKLSIPVSVLRRGEFKDELKLQADGLPDQIKPKEVAIGGGAGDGKLEIELTQNNIKPGTYTFYLSTEAKRKYGRNVEAVTAAEAEQKQAEMTVATFTEKQKTATTAKDEATKKAAEAEAALKTSQQNATNAANEAKKQADALKAANDKLTQAKDAASKDAANQALVDAANAAQKVVDDLTAVVKTADETKATADKAVVDATAARDAANTAKTESEAAAKLAMDQLAQANQLKQAADKRLTDTRNANQMKDVNFMVVSSPIKLRIVPTPLTITPAAEVAVKQKEKSELTIKLDRKYEFADAVELSIELPPGVQGIQAPKVNVPQGGAEGKLEIMAGDNATVGEHLVTIRAKGKFNNVDIGATTQVKIKVEAAPAAQ